ncbi:hypothetical protein SAMN04488505_1011408 [Chitinophaga rupis]|uniref:DUF6377 domain-containing protein n=1 Tax=Chitinophaga rupis TaxID=573321 RepID=A0A1H7M5M2_9BACT|nr:DUF6377 domain-containing protein [Chitinophaga rupis]SEL06422.1 hypothetical protein SAMN04488505_1011408 [Chitinophaga rupis]
MLPNSTCHCFSAILFYLLLLIPYHGSGQDGQAQQLAQLSNAISNVPVYDAQRQHKIDSLKKTLVQVMPGDFSKQFDVYTLLYEEYRLFQYDSSYHYARKLGETALLLKDTGRIMYARIKLAFSLLSSGMYKEAYDSLAGIHTQWLPDSSKAEYYALLGRYYYDLGDFDNDQYHTPIYNVQGSRYMDSALALLPANTYQASYYRGLKELKAGNKERASEMLTQLLNDPSLTQHQVAVTTSTLSDLYIRNGETDKAIQLLATAVIADIQSSTKETSAAFNLASLLYKKGDVKNASLCINQAVADAEFYGARQRKVQVSTILPFIEAQKLSMVESQKRKLLFYAATVTLLLLLIIGLAVIVWQQVKKLKAAQKIITRAHVNELEINRQLAETNARLEDANKIKEKYIGYFFNFNAEFYDKIEKLKRSLEQKVADRKLDDVKTLIAKINLRKEKEELISNFDHAFLKLFPNFVTVFNSMFREEDQLLLKEGELLNTDLRIFALIRMGIHDSEKIAHILQYSVNTITTYKTKIKNKSIVPNEEFEKRVMEIKAV